MTIAPVSSAERLQLIDILRGFALLGILLVNFMGNRGPYFSVVDSAVITGLDALVDSSFYPLFSLLFGLGFAIQLLRARERGAAIAVLYMRRMIVLFLIGTAHAVIIWRGDILVSYALFGLFLIPLQKLPTRAVLAIAVALSIPTLLAGQIRTTIDASRAASEDQLIQGVRAEGTRLLNNLKARESAHGGGSYMSAVAVRWQQYGTKMHLFTDWLWVVRNDILLFFVVGFYVGRRELLQKAAQHRRTWGIVAAVGLLAAVSANIYNFVVPEGVPQLASAVVVAGDVGPTAFYLATITLLVTAGGRVARALAVFAHAGRMGLTNYLMQSIVMTLLFNAYGFNLQNPGALLWVLLNISFFFLVQVPFSRWWLARFHFGPAEWVWRSATYGRRQPMVRFPLAIAAPTALADS